EQVHKIVVNEKKMAIVNLKKLNQIRVKMKNVPAIGEHEASNYYQKSAEAGHKMFKWYWV
ncbi:1929_t:CDS:2, partial [Racocetra fulgida]